MRVEMNIGPGQSYSGALELTNETGGPMRIRGELLDFTLDKTMTPQFARSMAEESEWSCRQWLTVNPMETEIGDAGKLIIRYTIRIPPDAPPKGYHCAAGFTAMAPAGEAKAIGMRNIVRAVAAFYATVGEHRAKGEVAGLVLEKAGNTSVAVLTLRNDAQVHLRPSGSLEALDAAGQAIESAVLPSFPVLPRREQRFMIPLKAEAPAIRALRVKVDLGMDEVQEATIRLDINGGEAN
ncbi:MAG: hypothetical protein C0504_02330 [Candidatus Solibacter sp.]|nr:hypothetical protein [Candidatus Solibacter sp.]